MNISTRYVSPMFMTGLVARLGHCDFFKDGCYSYYMDKKKGVMSVSLIDGNHYVVKTRKD